jgi:hypothetical protein
VDLENLPLRAFVLGLLPDGEAAPITAAAQTDAVLADAIHAVEAELFDEAATGRLDVAERAAFDARFGAEPDTARRLSSARVFARLVERHAQGGLEALIDHAVTTSGAYARMPLPSGASSLHTPDAAPRPAESTPAADIVDAPVASAAHEEAPSPLLSSPTPLIEAAPSIIAVPPAPRAAGAASPLAPLPSLPTPPPSTVTPIRRRLRAWSGLAVALAAGLGLWFVRPASAPVSLRLEPAVLRAADDAPRARLGDAPLALELALDEPRAPASYAVRIVGARGDAVWRADALPGEALRVRVTIPARALAPGAYVVHLTEGTFERAYPLEVVRDE